MKFLQVALVQLGVLEAALVAQAAPGAVSEGMARAEYNSVTGEIVISANNIVNWYIESESLGLTGASPQFPTYPTEGVLPTNDDKLIGETGIFTPMTFTDVNLGAVAKPGLHPNELTITWNDRLGGELLNLPLGYFHGSGPVNYSPTAAIRERYYVADVSGNIPFVLDASNTVDDGVGQPLSYRWDLDYDGIFETDAGNDSTFEIEDLSDVFDGIGRHSLIVEVSDGDFVDTARSSLTLFDSIPKGPSRGPGMAPLGTALAVYNPETGEVIVSVNNVLSWSITSESQSLTGRSPSRLPGSIWRVHSENEFITQSAASNGTLAFTNASLIYSAPAGLPLEDLSISFRSEYGQPFQTMPVMFFSDADFAAILTPEPTTITLATSCLLALFYHPRIYRNVGRAVLGK